jgi:ferritin
MLKIFRYINDVGGRAISPEISGLTLDYDSLKAVFEQALDQEVNNTQSINRIVDRCYKVKDYTVTLPENRTV